MKRINIKISKDKDTYSIEIGKNVINQLSKKIRKYCPKTENVALIVDKNIPIRLKRKIFTSLRRYNVTKLEFLPSEKIKSISTANLIINKLISKNFNRNDLVIAIGGGIIGDITSFVASIYKRGLNFINVPTSLLAQVDSSIGGKTGVNTIHGKNLIGTFYQPKIVLIDVSFLMSLNKKELICGYAEILKHSLIKDKKFFNWLLANSKKILEDRNLNVLSVAIKKSCEIKKSFVVRDVSEKNLRKKLNFGHTFAHAIEAGTKYSKKINHGEAVLVGMILATQLSYTKKICSKSTLNNLKLIYRKNRLNIYLKKKFRFRNIPSLLKFMIHDKKNEDKKINLILIKEIGKVTEPGKYKFTKEVLKNDLKKLTNFNF